MGPISHFCSQAKCPCSRRSSLPAVQRNPHGLQQLWQALLANSGSVVILSHWSYQWTQKFGHLGHPTIQELSNLWVQHGPTISAQDARLRISASAQLGWTDLWITLGQKQSTKSLVNLQGLWMWQNLAFQHFQHFPQFCGNNTGRTVAISDML